MKDFKIPSLRAQSNLVKLGSDIAIARKKRRMTQKRLADGASVNVETIRRLEKGHPGISIGVLAMVLSTLGEPDIMGNLLDMAKDDIGLLSDAFRLPKRVRTSRTHAINKEKIVKDTSVTENGVAF